jgi:hypothetical protein
VRLQTLAQPQPTIDNLKDANFLVQTFKAIGTLSIDELTFKEVAKTMGILISKPYLKWITISDKQMMNAKLKLKMPLSLVKDLTEMGASQKIQVFCLMIFIYTISIYYLIPKPQMEKTTVNNKNIAFKKQDLNSVFYSKLFLY